MSEPTIPDQLDSIASQFSAGNERMRRLEEGQIAHDRRLKRMEDQLIENTDLTRDAVRVLTENSETLSAIKDAGTTVRVGRKVVIWAGSLAAGAVGLWQGWQEIAKHWPHK